jgi:phenylalanyl-tRNA synthetase beta chain
MLISLNWINELLEIENINLNELIEKLTLGGFEVEDNFELLIGSNKETILEISATANRADSISAKGIAKEIGSLIDKKAFQNQYVKNTSELEDVLQQSLSNNEILDKQYCSSFIAITVENFIDITVPEWLKQKLISSGVEPVNSLVDFQNYILLEMGYPFEFYDLDKIRNDLNESEFELKLTKAGTDKSLIGTNDSEYKLETDTLVVKANELLLSVAGLIPNQKYAIDQTTKSLLIEGAIFNSKKIRQTSRKLGLRTDRSARYEKSLNNHSFNESLVRLLNLLRINNSQIIYKTTACAQIINEPIKSIPLIYQNILEILGPTIKNGKETQITTDQISRYLDRLDFNFSFEPTTAKWDVIVPSSRIDDIIREIDLIEEIGRLHGFNNFVSYLPNISNIGAEDFSYQTRKKLTTCFLSEGLNELMQYSLVKETANNTQTVKLVNPLISDCSTLRTSLLPAIIETIEKNVKQGNRNIEGFEFGHVFSTTAPNVYNENELV